MCGQLFPDRCGGKAKGGNTTKMYSQTESQDDSQDDATIDETASAVDIGLFIETIQNYEFLYNLSDPLYKNQKTKLLAWQEIAAVFNITVEECQKIWKALRDKFVKEKNKGSSGSEAPESSWEHFNKMMFYVKYTKPRKTYSATKPEKKENKMVSRPASTTSVWSNTEMILSPTSSEEYEKEPPTATGRKGVKRKKKDEDEIQGVLEVAKTICSTISDSDDKPNCNKTFCNYVLCRLQEMDVGVAKEKRREMLLILEQ